MSERRPPGRPSSLTPEVHEHLIKVLRSGCTHDAAAEAIGMSTRALRKWLQKGDDAEVRRDAGEKLTAQDGRYLAFAEDARKARAEAEVRAVTTIQRAAANGTWQAAAWYLERAFPERWSSKPANKMGRPVGAVSAPDRAAGPPKLKVLRDAG
jgi:hypothetical protein